MYRLKYQLKTCDYDKNKEIKVSSWFHFLQDISTRHFESVLEAHNDVTQGIWVIVQWEFRKIQEPEKSTFVWVDTKPTYFRKFIAYREYAIYDEGNRLLVTATSKWAYLDPSTRKQGSIPKQYNTWFSVPDLAKAPDKIQPLCLDTPIKHHHEVRVRYSDMDINNHVNNVAYIQMALDALYETDAFTGGEHTFLQMTVGYKKEVTAFQSLRIQTEMQEKGRELSVSQSIFDTENALCFWCDSIWSCDQ